MSGRLAYNSKVVPEPELLLQIPRGADSTHFAFVEYRFPLRKNICLVQVMCCEKNASAKILHVNKQVPQKPTICRIHARRRLVQEDHWSCSKQASSHPETALLSAAKRLDNGISLLLQAHRRQGLGNIFVRLSTGDTAQSREESKVLPDGELEVERIVLRTDTHVSSGLRELGRNVNTTHLNGTGRHWKHARDAIDGRGLSCAIVPKQGKDFPTPNLKAHAINGTLLLESLHKVYHLQGWCIWVRIASLLSAHPLWAQAEVKRLCRSELALVHLIEPDRKKAIHDTIAYQGPELSTSRFIQMLRIGPWYFSLKGGERKTSVGAI
mmetsp:Transcript_61093/g.106406  ORF Transcript_61093/g.106406 Transcript_61093/m.106406 type:complete len:324 (-) Transcript_61093:899-1870(-)